MIWLLEIPLLILGVVVPAILLLGALASNARVRLALAADCIFQREFDNARAHILTAVRLKPSFRSNPDVKNLYEICVSKDSSISTLVHVREIKSALSLIPKTKIEIIYGDKRFKFLIIALVTFAALTRIDDLHRAFSGH